MGDNENKYARGAGGSLAGAGVAPVRPGRGLSLRAKVTLWILVCATAIHLAFGAIVLLYQRASVDTFFSARLARAQSRTVQDLMDRDLEVDEEGLRDITSRMFILPEQSVMAVYRVRDGRVVSTRPGVPSLEELRSQMGKRPSPVFLREWLAIPVQDHDDGVWRIMVESRANRAGEQFYVLAAGADSYAESMYSVVSSVLMLTIPAGIAIALACGWVVGGLATRPISRLGELAGSLAPERLDQPLSAPSEVPEVAKLQQRLEESRTRLRAALAAQDRFISNVSHELRTPVSVLLAEAQTLPREGMSPIQSTFMDSVTDEMRRLGRMVESFLTLTRLRAGEGPSNVRRCDLNEIVMHSLEGCGSTARSQECVLAPQLHESTVSPEVAGDEDLLRILLDNLVRNAMRFSPPHGRIVVAVAEEAAELSVTVTDEGPGISTELLGRLFDRFAQANDEAVRGRGYGLGLSIAQGIAELHGGRIEARNLPVRGCEFRVILPRASEPPAGAEGAGVNEQAPGSPGPARGRA